MYGGSGNVASLTVIYPTEYINCSMNILSCLECCENEKDCSGTVVWNSTNCFYAINPINTTWYELIVVWVQLSFILLIVVGYVYSMRHTLSKKSQSELEKTVKIWKPIMDNLDQQNTENRQDYSVPAPNGPKENSDPIEPTWQ